MPRSQRQPKPLPFTEAQIRERAYRLWQERGDRASSEDNWQAAIAALLQERSLLGRTHRVLKSPSVLIGRTWQLLRLSGSADNPKDATETLKAGISALGLAATIFAGVGLYLTYVNGQQERQLNTERLLTDRFSKSVEQLGSKESSVRIGGIYSLERLAKDSPKDHWTVMEVLTAFVRERSPKQKASPTPLNGKLSQTNAQALSPLPTDVQSALTAIGRRDASKETEGQSLNLINTYLVKANLEIANLQGAYFYNANLQGANLNSANLQGAALSGTNLQEAFLYRANLQKAILYSANLQEATLNSANLPGAILSSANLQKANFYSANLQGANFYSANLQKANLNSANLQGAYFYNANLQKAILNSANLKKAALSGANVQGAILLTTDLRNTQQLTQTQLEGAEPPLLCHVALPPEIKVDPNRDCDRMPQALVKLKWYSNIEDAKRFVDEARQKRWQ